MQRGLEGVESMRQSSKVGAEMTLEERRRTIKEVRSGESGLHTAAMSECQGKAMVGFRD